VNIPLEEYEHHMIDRLVRRYPNKPSRGTTIPMIATRTSGSRQYPSTDAERGNVNEDEKWELPRCPWSWLAAASPGESGGDMRAMIVWRSIVPRTARPAVH